MTLVTQSKAEEFARAYTEAWCSHDPELVASFFAESSRFTINDGEPSDRRDGIAAMAQDFMDTFPDIIVHMDDVRSSGTYAVLRWTLEGHNTGAEGACIYVKVSGWEYWRFDNEGLIAESFGHFNADDYERQLNGG